MSVNLKINDENYAVDLEKFPADITLVTYLREQAQLTATKYMCLEGGCGACVCAITEKHPVTGEIQTKAANSCLMLLNTCIDRDIITSEGIGNKTIGYHPIQKRMAKMHATQCGFCTPGFVMNMWALLESKGGTISQQEVENSFGGNICRCTGYRPILDAMKSFASNSKTVVPEEICDIEDFEWVSAKTCPKTGLKCASSSGISGGCKQSLMQRVQYPNGRCWYWPRNLVELFQALQLVGSNKYMLVAGNTAHGVYRRDENIMDFIQVGNILELKKYWLDGVLCLGANITLTEAIEIFGQFKTRPGFEYLDQLAIHFAKIANVPVRNWGTLAGNITIKKEHPEFPSDIFLTFETLEVMVVVSDSPTTQRRMSLIQYIRTATPKAVLTTFELKPYPKERFIFNSYKITPRMQNAHAYVNAGFLLEMNAATGNVNSARICFGNIRSDFTHAANAENFLAGKNLYDHEVLTKIFQLLAGAINPEAVLPEPSPEYRRLLSCGLFYKFVLLIAPANKVRSEYHSGGFSLARQLSSGVQRFETDPSTYPVTQPVEKVEAMIQTTGEAIYMNDVPIAINSVYCAFATATRVGATISLIDATAALLLPGVIAFYTAADIPGINSFVNETFLYVIDELLCAGKVKYYDQPYGIMVAETSYIANAAIKRIKVTYVNVFAGEKPIFLTATDVLEANAKERIVCTFESKLSLSALHLSVPTSINGRGVFQVGGQFCFSLEPLTTIAVPIEQGLQIYCTTQWMDHTQLMIAQMLKVNVNSVQLVVRRLGGAYGFKISSGNKVGCAAALVAHKLQRQARFVQTIESMMETTGKRWACRSDYEFRVDSKGKILQLKNTFYQDAGINVNENPFIQHSPLIARNCYQLDERNSTLTANVVLTDAPSSIWVRAPGALESIAMMENIIEHIAFETNTDPADVRLINMKPGNKLLQLLPRFLKNNEYRARRKEIDDFNSKNRWRKRGIGLAIMEYDVSYLGQFQATVAIYHGDGSVAIKHGGIEMGQGLNTKASQVAAYILGIPLDKVKIEASDSINGATSFVTGGSIGSESVCYAVRQACYTLNDRLKPIRDQLGPNATFEAVLKIAYTRHINLVASEHYKTGDLQPYMIYGLALTQLELDVLIGNSQIQRVDICQDTGNSLSPNIDIGQIEGAFTMSLGYWLMEKLVYDRTTGRLVTNRTWNYKVPGALDIPIDFRIELLPGSPNSTGFMRSKTSGEPPCCLGVSTIFAMQHAVQSVRTDNDLPRQYIRFGAPTTPEDVVMATEINEGMYKLG